MSMGGGWQAVTGRDVVHEDGQRRIQSKWGKGVGAERLARHCSPASSRGSQRKRDVIFASFPVPFLDLFPSFFWTVFLKHLLCGDWCSSALVCCHSSLLLVPHAPSASLTQLSPRKPRLKRGREQKLLKPRRVQPFTGRGSSPPLV